MLHNAYDNDPIFGSTINIIAQNKSISENLKYGFRGFEIDVESDKNKNLICHHPGSPITTTFEEQIKQISDYIKENQDPNDKILIFLQNKAHDNSLITKAINKYFLEDDIKFSKDINRETYRQIADVPLEKYPRVKFFTQYGESDDVLSTLEPGNNITKNTNIMANIPFYDYSDGKNEDIPLVSYQEANQYTGNVIGADSFQNGPSYFENRAIKIMEAKINGGIMKVDHAYEKFGDINDNLDNNVDNINESSSLLPTAIELFGTNPFISYPTGLALGLIAGGISKKSTNYKSTTDRLFTTQNDEQIRNILRDEIKKDELCMQIANSLTKCPCPMGARVCYDFGYTTVANTSGEQCSECLRNLGIASCMGTSEALKTYFRYQMMTYPSQLIGATFGSLSSNGCVGCLGGGLGCIAGCLAGGCITAACSSYINQASELPRNSEEWRKREDIVRDKGNEIINLITQIQRLKNPEQIPGDGNQMNSEVQLRNPNLEVMQNIDNGPSSNQELNNQASNQENLENNNAQEIIKLEQKLEKELGVLKLLQQKGFSSLIKTNGCKEASKTLCVNTFNKKLCTEIVPNSIKTGCKEGCMQPIEMCWKVGEHIVDKIRGREP